MNFTIRSEKPADIPIIRQVTQAAFEVAEHSSGTEGAIVDALRAANALTVSLVATVDEEVVGHVAFSPITIDGASCGWFGLGPVSVRPDLHRRGIASELIREGLARLTLAGAGGCVVVGDPRFYQRFGFKHDPTIRYEGVPPQYFMKMSLDGSTASGSVAYHKAFAAV